jgi:hypothetical protein
MHILPYKLDTTNDLLTSRAGLLSIAQLMNTLNLGERIDKHFPLPKSNRGYKPSAFIQTFILMQQSGSFHLDDVRHISDDKALRTVLGLNSIPKASAQWTYKKKKGFMPMVGHIAQTGQIVAVDFRPGNASPARENLEFIKQCQNSLPQGCIVAL